MAIRKTKPTSPGRRFATYQLREELTADEPHKALTKGKPQVRRAQLPRPRHLAPSRRRRQAPLPRDRLQAPQGRRAGEGRDDRVRPEPHLLHRPAALRRRRTRATSSPRRASAPGDDGRVGRQAPTSSPATRCRCARSRPAPSSTTSSWSPARAAGSAAPPASAIQVVAKEGADGHPAPALLGDADGPRRVPRDGRHALQRRAPERQDRQGRPQPPQGQAPADPRRRDEPGRPPARRRRGAPHARRPPGDPVGQADARLPHPQEGQAAPTR